MSKLARVLAVGALLTAMSLASAAHAQDGEAPSQQAGITQSDPSQPQPPGEVTPQSPDTPEQPGPPGQPAPSEEPAPPEEPAPDEEPGTAEESGTTPGSTTTTRPPVVQPESLPVTVSPRTGGPGTTVTVRADLRGCTRPGSAQGFFRDRLAYGVDGASRRLVREHVAGGRWYSAQYPVTNRDAVGQGEFGVVCDFNLPTATEGHATFRVQPSRSPVPVQVTPGAAARGTTVRITAEVGRCERIHIWFYDSRSDGLTQAGGAQPITSWQVTPAGTLTARYTLTRKNAIGPARFSVVCGLDFDNARVGEASFRVLAANGQHTGGDDQTANRNNNTQLPNRIDTGQGGTADGGGQGSLDPVLLLPAVGLLLITLAAGLWLGQRTPRRRR
jgi:hypothetical protein